MGVFFFSPATQRNFTNTSVEELVEGITAPVDTNENILATFSHVWDAGTTIRWLIEATCSNNTNTKNIRLRLGGIGGTIYYQRNMVNTTGITVQGTISNRGVTNSQVGSVIAGSTHTGTLLAWGKTTSTIETSAGTDLVVTVEKTTGSDVMTLERLIIEIL